MATNMTTTSTSTSTNGPLVGKLIQAGHSLQALPCYLVNNLTNSEEQCKFIIDNDCLEDDATIDYVYLVYCELGYGLRYAAISLIVFLVIILFLNLSVVADEFLCPSLLAVARNLRMSDQLAGITLLAFGNGCPDIFASLAAASNNRPELIIGELLGAGIFCTSIVAGLVFIHSDFKLARRPLLRDATFYLLAVYLIWLYCYNEQITFYGSLAFIVIYAVYLVVALSGQAIHSKLRGSYPIAETQTNSEIEEKEKNENWFNWREESLRRRQREKLDKQNENSEPTSQLSSKCHCNKQSIKLDQKNKQNNVHLGRDSSLGQPSSVVVAVELALDTQLRSIVAPGEGHTNRAFVEEDFCSHQRESTCEKQPVAKLIESYSSSSYKSKEKSNPPVLEISTQVNWTEWDDFMDHLNPIDSDNWTQMSLTSKFINVLRAPLLFVTILTIPVVDCDKRNNNWCRLLNSLHCFMVPLAIMLSLASDQMELFGVPWRFVLLMPGAALALFVFYTSNGHEPPRFHVTFAYFGFIMSVLWVYLLANEIISLLKTVGIIFSMTDTAIGLGVLAWGNSLGDIVANLSLAEAGYPRMALGASIGAPLLNLLLGFGLSFTIYLKPGETSQIDYSSTITLLCSTLAIILVCLMVSTLIAPNRSKKYFGYLLMSGYGVYFALAVCLECNLIQFN